MTTTDPFTMDLRLCDDGGLVSHEPIDEPPGPRGKSLDGSYLARLNRLRNLSRTARGDKPEFVTEPFTCTGDAHLAGEHFRCTSPAHKSTPMPDQPRAGGPLFRLGRRMRLAVGEFPQQTTVTLNKNDVEAVLDLIDKAAARYEGRFDCGGHVHFDAETWNALRDVSGRADISTPDLDVERHLGPEVDG